MPAGHGDASPQGLDWDACLGWLPKIPWDPKRYFNRFAYWDFSTGGQTGGLFVHMVDVVHWYLGLHKPKSAVALGGIYQYNDGRDTADNINAIVDYAEGLNVTFEATITDMIRQGGRRHRLHGNRRAALDLPRRLSLHPGGQAAARRSPPRLARGSPHGELAGLRAHPQAAELRRRRRTLLGHGLPPVEPGLQEADSRHLAARSGKYEAALAALC